MEPKQLILNNEVDIKGHGIYMIYVVTTGKAYIGQSKNMKRREYGHFSKLVNNKHDNKHLQNSYNKYGKQSLLFIPLENCTNEELVARENHYIDLIGDWALNCQAGALMTYMTEEQKLKMSIAKKGKSIGKRGPVSEETRAKLKEATTNLWKDPDFREKTTNSHVGKEQPQEQIDKRVASMKETKLKKLADGTYGKGKLTVEQVKEIKKLLNEGKTCIELGKQYNVSRLTISSIKRGDSWKDVISN